jgi:uncharacterized membrane protein HdeD (DUF308 family)
MSYAQTQSPLVGALLRPLADKWWLLLLRGLIAIAFGFLAFYGPGTTLLSLTLLFGAYVLADGVFALWAAVSGDGADSSSRWWLAAVGIISILAGLATFFWPGMTAFVLLMFIAGWAIATGALEIWGAIQLRKEIDGEWALILTGILSVAFGVFVFARPDTGALALIYTIGVYAILSGIFYIVLAFRLKQYKTPG